MKQPLLLSFLLYCVVWLPKQAIAQSACAPIPGLILRLALDEQTGTTAQDATGRQVASTLTGGNWRPTSGWDGGGALELTGSNSQLTIPLAWQPHDFTVSFWIKPGGCSNFSQVVGATGGWNQFLFHSDDQYSLNVGTEVAHKIRLPYQLQVGSWQHFVFTFASNVGAGTGTGTGTVYKNGVLLASRTDMQVPSYWPGMSLGNKGDALYDELRVYDRALSAAEAAILARCSSAASYLPPSDPSPNTELNWTLERSYDGQGNVVAESKQFTDGLGRATQAQARNAATQQVFAAQTIYNTGGQAVLQTLAAPTNNQDFKYRSDFVTGPTGSAYGPANFEQAKALNPDPVAASIPGTLGHYFSAQNAQEPLTPITSFPYSLVEPYEGPLGGTRRAAGPGDELRMGKGHESRQRDFPVRHEFNDYLNLRQYFVPGSTNTVSLQYQATKTVSIGPDGQEQFVVTNKEGQAIISGLSGAQYPALEVYGFISSEASNPYDQDAPVYQDIHIPAAGPQEVTFTMDKSTSSDGRVRIIDLLTDVVTDYPILVTAQGITEPVLHVPLLPGFYRFVSLIGTQWSYYLAHYGNFSYTYYDDAGRVVATVAPNGLPGALNYVRNPGFEQDQTSTTTPSAWQSDGPTSYTESAQSVHGGQYCGVQYGPYASGHNSRIYQVVTGLPDGLYTLRAWVKNTGGNDIAQMVAENYGGAQMATNIPVTYSWGDWQQVQLSNINVQGGRCQIGFYSASLTDKWIAFDDVELVRQADGSAPQFATRNIYDTSSRLLSTESNEAGRSEYVYARDGRIRFSQSALQRGKGLFSYSNYDEIGRVVESGECEGGATEFENHLTTQPAGNSVLQPAVLESRDRSGGLDPGACSQRNQVWYDLPFDGTPDSQGADQQLIDRNRTQQFVLGAVAKTQNDHVTTWYSYDELGRVTWVVQNIEGLGVKTLDYQYDFSGNVLQVAYQRDQPDSFFHHYAYDAAQRLTTVYTSPDAHERTLQAEYSYYLHGPLKRVQIAGNLQGIDYTYTLQGALKNINHVNPSLEPGHDSPRTNGVYKDLFAFSLDYFSGDYRSRNLDVMTPLNPGVPTRYDGTIQGAAWRTPANAGVQHVSYAYDEKSQLQRSTYNKLGISGAYYHIDPPTVPNALQEGGMTYDPNGNIQSLRRTNQAGAVTDNFSYSYKPNTNQLAAVHTGSPDGATVLDYDYDELGQMTRQTDEQGERYFTYDVTGKTTGVYLDDSHQQPVVTYAYDDRGFRVSKTSTLQPGGAAPTGQITAKTTYYVRDMAGNVLAVYETPTNPDDASAPGYTPTDVPGGGTISIGGGFVPAAGPIRTEVPLYGSGRLGTLTRLNDGTDDYRYELTDHLGDARVIFHRPTTVTDVEMMEPTNGPTRADFLNRELYRVYRSGAPSGAYVARLTSPAPAGQELKRVLYVLKGDTITFSAQGLFERLEEGRSSGHRASRLRPYLLLGAGATASDQALPDEASQSPASLAGPGKWLGRVSAGLSFTLGGHQASPLTKATQSPSGWLRCRVLDEQGTPVGPDQYVYLGGTGNWEKLRQGVRVQQNGTIELMAGTNGGGIVYFDNLTVEQTGGLIVQEQHPYAYGAPLPGLSYTVGNRRYRHGYQGQYAEHDDETGFESFELRLYNSRLGRWSSYDPEGQFSSPYVGMGNNPVSRVDPDGGFSPLFAMGIGAGVGAIAGGLYSQNHGGDFGSGALAGAAVGAIAGGFAWAGLQDTNINLFSASYLEFFIPGIGTLNIFTRLYPLIAGEIAKTYPGAKGMAIDVDFDDSPKANRTLRWFQTLRTNYYDYDHKPVIKPGITIVDRDPPPYSLLWYYDDIEQGLSSDDINGHRAVFGDSPSQPKSNTVHKVRFETSLVELDGYESLSPKKGILFNFTWGYNIKPNGKVRIIRPVLKAPSKAQLYRLKYGDL